MPDVAAIETAPYGVPNDEPLDDAVAIRQGPPGAIAGGFTRRRPVSPRAVPDASDSYDWQCGGCGTLVERPDTRRCPNCGGINFYPLADEVPGGARGTVETDLDVGRVLDELSAGEG